MSSSGDLVGLGWLGQVAFEVVLFMTVCLFMHRGVPETQQTQTAYAM